MPFFHFFRNLRKKGEKMEIRTYEYKKASVSTNTELKEEIYKSDVPLYKVISASFQTGGRGRQGRSFYSPAGGIYFSASFPLTGKEDNIPFLTLLSGFAVQKELQKYTEKPIAIKWPNDIYVSRKKLCGILTELIQGKNGLTAVVGVGINAALSEKEIPEELKTVLTSLSIENIKIPDKKTLIEAIVSELDGLIYEKKALFGSQSPFCDEINKVSLLNGKTVQREVNGKIITGTVKKISPKGSLILTDEDENEIEVTTGEILCSRAL